MDKTELSIAILGAFSFAYCITDSTLSIYLENLGLNSLQIALMFSALAFSFIVSSPIIGGLSEFISKKYILLSSIFFAGISYVFLVIGRNYILLVLSQIILGIGVSGVTIISMSEIEKYIKTNRGFRTGISFSVQYFGKFLGPLVGGMIAFLYTSKVSIYFTILAFLVLLILVNFIYEDKKSIPSKKDIVDILLDFEKFEKNKELFFVSLTGFIEFFLINIKYIFIPLILVEMGISILRVGIVVASFYLLSSLEVIFIGKFLDKIKLGPMMIISTIILPISFILIYLSSNFYFFLLSSLLASIAIGVIDVSTSEAIFSISKRDQEENYGFYLGFSRIGGFIGFVISGFIAQFFGIRKLFLISGIVVILIFLFYLCESRNIFSSQYLFKKSNRFKNN